MSVELLEIAMFALITELFFNAFFNPIYVDNFIKNWSDFVGVFTSINDTSSITLA